MRNIALIVAFATGLTLCSSSHAQTTQPTLADLDKRLAAAEQKLASQPRQAADANPNIAVIVNALGSYSTNRANPALNRFDTGELEIELRSAVDPRADAVGVLSFARDVENPVFGTTDPVEPPSGGAEVEEAYLFLHDFGVKNLIAKLGRYHLRFGRQNLLHSHDLPTSDSSFVTQAFLAPESLSDAGIELSYLIPNPWDQYIEIIGELNTGEGASSESPIFKRDFSIGAPACLAHVLWNSDISNHWNMELGTSMLYGKTNPDDSSQSATLFGYDATFIRTDPRGQFRNFILQTEGIYGLVDQVGGNRTESFGAYLLAQQQLHKDWYIGTRLDWTQNPDDSRQEVWGVSPYVSWYWSEFLRFRVEYQHKAGDIPHEENSVLFQVTWVFGAHPPHPYWSMR